jgi:uncharacterized protein YlxW (UPF0749 family)
MTAGRGAGGAGTGSSRRVWRALVPAIALVAGMLFATSAETARGSDLRGGRRVELAQLVSAQERTVGEANLRAITLQGDIDELERSASSGDARVGAARAQGDRLESYVGLRPVRGAGLTVLLDDAPRRQDGSLPQDARPDDVIVHQQDVQSVVNALWAGGADSMAVMGQRLITTGAVRCVGNTLLLYGRTYSPPFTITAIGDAGRLRRSLDAEPGVILYRQAVAYFGLGYEVKDEHEVTLPAYEGPLRLGYAQAVSQ